LQLSILKCNRPIKLIGNGETDPQSAKYFFSLLKRDMEERVCLRQKYRLTRSYFSSYSSWQV